MNKVEVALKTGKIAFTWNDVGSWIKPDALSNSANGTTVLELPLKVVAPLFISQHRPITAQKKLAVDENIPDIFAGNRAKPVAPVAPPPAIPTAPAMPPTSPTAPIIPSGLPKPPPSGTPIAPSGLPKPPALPTPQPPALPKMSPAPAAPIGIPKPPTAAPTAPSLPKPPAPALPKPLPLPTMPVATPATPIVATAKEPQTLGELFGDPSKKEWSPKEIVQKTNQLKGVAGSMISLADGLMVAGELPAPFRAETTAAFLPQIFGRMNQYSKELHLGDMNGVSMECQRAPMRIIRTGMVFFGVLGRAGETLPEAQIRLIAEELAKQNK
jgi:predicted regulator of Ras-like GTPase activity (Roadblock/LC7/MglB family)